MSYLFTSESVSEGHPDKVADQISDSILDAMLRQDPNSRVACETLVTTGLVMVAGEVTTQAYVEIPDIVRETILRIGYNHDDYQFNGNSCGVLTSLHSQSPDIARGVNVGGKQEKEQGAGDQGMMFGYATNETPEFMPMSLAFSHRILRELARIRKEEPDLMNYLRPDSKSQVTIEYDKNGKPARVHTIVVSTQHDEFVNKQSHPDLTEPERDLMMLEQIKSDVQQHVVPQVIPPEFIDNRTIYHVNPTGKFVIGGPHGDAGLTGRKIIVDTYGGKGAHGGGAFSGKDPSKVDRSAAYATRHIAKNLVAAGIADEVLVQVAYAIGIAKPVSITVNTFGTSHVDFSDDQIAEMVEKIFDMRPKSIIDRFDLLKPIYSPTAAYGHMGREPYTGCVEVNYVGSELISGERPEVRSSRAQQVEAKFFAWEELDYVDKVKHAFGVR
jgi:S-adenosylmethionine synthetase